MTKPTPSDIANPRIDEADLAVLLRHGTRTRLHDDEPLFRAGERRGGFFVVLEGAIEVLDRAGGESRPIMIHGPRQFTGDIDIITRRRPVVGAVARGETEVLGISSQEIRRIIAEQPRLGELFLRAFIARREELLESGLQGLRVFGSGGSRDALEIREFLSRNQVPFSWIDVEEDPGIGKLLDDLGLADGDLPAVAVGTDPLLRDPSLRAVAEAVGLRRPFGSEVYDFVIVGAGPAGLAAAVYASSEGLSTVVLDRAAPGGQAGASTKIENYLGFPTGITGEELIGRATLQAQKFGAELSSPARVAGLDLNGQYPAACLDSGERVEARCLLIATGADYRKLDVPHRERFDGKGVYYAATPIELAACRGRDVVVVGAGNSAGQAAMFLAEHTHRVWLLVRGEDLRKNMSSYLADRIEAADNIEVHFHTEIRRLIGEDRLEQVLVERMRTGEERIIETPAVFSFIGAVPRTGWLPRVIETDANGFIRTGGTGADTPHWTRRRDPFLLETSVPGIFAAGDVRHGAIPRISSAVGEGAMAVKFVHEFLAESET